MRFGGVLSGHKAKIDGSFRVRQKSSDPIISDKRTQTLLWR